MAHWQLLEIPESSWLVSFSQAKTVVTEGLGR